MIIPDYAQVSELHKKAYQAFYNMHTRCFNPQSSGYEYYGGRGITVKGFWNIAGRTGFVMFLKDLGLPPSENHSLDRIDPNGHYEPNNCRWASSKEQRINQRLRQYTCSDVISYDKAHKKYKLYRKNLDLNTKLYLGWFDSLKDAEDKYAQLYPKKVEVLSE